jgi:1,4-dihydroxy-2-naphthoate polyprenyltransferase
MTTWRIWIHAVRPGTLWAAVGPVVVGTGVALADGVMHPLSAALAMLAAVLIQIATNLNNDYQDFLKGADDGRSGPLRVTQAGLVSPAIMRTATAVSFALASMAGAYLMWRGGWPIVLVGVLSIACGIWYTTGRYSLAYLGLGDVFVLIFFGPVAVGGTYYVQALTMPWYVPVAGLGPGLLAVAILLVNNIRDAEGDRQAGKMTLVARFGRAFGVRLYGAAIAGAAGLPVVLYAAGYAPAGAFAAAAVAAVGLLYVSPLSRAGNAMEINPFLGRTARLLLLYCLVLAAGWNL